MQTYNQRNNFTLGLFVVNFMAAVIVVDDNDGDGGN
jgi:hypothetical protein